MAYTKWTQRILNTADEWAEAHKTTFICNSDGDLHWKRTFGAYAGHGRIAFIVPLVIVSVATGSRNPLTVGICALSLGLFVLYLWSWTLTLSADSQIVFGSKFGRTRTIHALDIHAISVPENRTSNPRGTQLLVNQKIVEFPNSSILLRRNRSIIADQVASWASCEVVETSEMSRLVFARKGFPERGYTRTTTQRS